MGYAEDFRGRTFWSGPEDAPVIDYLAEQQAGEYYAHQIGLRFNNLGGTNRSTPLQSTHHADLPPLPPGVGVYSLLQATEYKGPDVSLKQIAAGQRVLVAAGDAAFNERAQGLEDPGYCYQPIGLRPPGRLIVLRRIFALQSHIVRTEDGEGVAYLIGRQSDEVQPIRPDVPVAAKPSPKPPAQQPRPAVTGPNIVLGEVRVGTRYREQHVGGLAVLSAIIAAETLLPQDDSRSLLPVAQQRGPSSSY